MSTTIDLATTLWDQILTAITSGKSAILIWGLNPVSLDLLQRFRTSGLSALVSGVVDSNSSFPLSALAGFEVLVPEQVAEREVDTLVIAEDAAKESALTNFARLTSQMPSVIMAGNEHLEFRDARFDQVEASSLVRSRAGGYPHMLVHLYQSLQYISRRKLVGSVAEFGVYKGGTTVFLAKTLRALEIPAKIYAFDTFAGFPPRRSVLDLYNSSHDEFSDYEPVATYCSGYDIELVRGEICDTYRRLDGIPLILSFFDTDNYSATRSALELCVQQTVPGGILAFDHYFSDEQWLYTLGERIAASEVLADQPIFNLHGTGIFIKW